MDTRAIVNLLGSALLAGLAGGFAAYQGGAGDWSTILSAGGAALLTGLVSHVRASPLLPSRGPFPE